MIIRPLLVGSLPSGRNDYTAPAGTGTVGLPTAGKIFTYADGTSSVAHKEMVEIDYSNSIVMRLPGTFFKLGNLADDNLFYYETPQFPIDPSTLGITYDNAFPIIINKNAGPCNQGSGSGPISCPPHATCIDGECIYNAAYVEEKTNAVIMATGLYTLTKPICACSCADPGCVAGSNCTGCTNTFTTVALGNSIDPTPGTASIGDFYTETQLIASDGTVYPGTYESDTAYINAWNKILVPGQLAKGINESYLKGVQTLRCLACIDAPCPIPCLDCDYRGDCGNATTEALGFAPLLLQTTDQANADDLIFR